jgi:outer membrane protein assembly factor BamB
MRMEPSERPDASLSIAASTHRVVVSKGAIFALLGALIAAALVFFVLIALRPKTERSADAVPLPLLKLKDVEDLGEPATTWPGWRGYNGQGIAYGSDPPVEFGPDKNVAWKTDVPGEGLSSPVIWDELVILTTALDAGGETSLYLLAYSTTDGDELWSTKVGDAAGPTHVKNGHASATPVLDRDAVYSFFGSTGLFRHDLATGDLVWQTDLGDLSHRWGTAASPVLYEELVIQLCDCQKESYLAAFDKQTGEQVWRTEREFSKGCWSTPALVSADDGNGSQRMELIVNGSDEGGDGGAVRAYRPGTGEELWRVRSTTQWVTPTPVIGPDRVISVSGRNGPIMAIRPGGKGDVESKNIYWRHFQDGAYIPSPVSYRNRLFVLGDNGRLDCYNIGDGTRIWRIEPGRGSCTGSLVAGAGRLYYADERGTVYVVAADDEGEVLARNQFRERCLTTPAIVGDRIYLRTESKLYCIE